MPNLKIMHNPHVNMATDLCELACNLDHYKNKLPSPLKEAAMQCVEELHDMAEVLLGDDAVQMYVAVDDMGKAH